MAETIAMTKQLEKNFIAQLVMIPPQFVAQRTTQPKEPAKEAQKIG